MTLVQNFQILKENDDGTYTILEDISTTIPLNMSIIIDLSNYIIIDDCLYYVLSFVMLEDAYENLMIEYELGVDNFGETTPEMWEEFINNAEVWLDNSNCKLVYFHHFIE